MDENPRLRPLQKNHWDTYRDLNKIIASDYCRENRIGLTSICVVDSEAEKVQSCIENAI